MSQFYPLKVKEVKKETNDTVSIFFEIPSESRHEFAYKAGQYITIKKVINGEDVRRAYSLSSSPLENDFRVAVKKINEGKMSSYLKDVLKAGDELEIMPPKGSFCIKDVQGAAHYVAFAVGSGITPVISMIKTVLKSNSENTFTLFYGNRTTSSTIYRIELDELHREFPENFKLNYILSKESVGNSLYEGRITKEKAQEFLKANITLLKADDFYMCGPEEMIFGVTEALEGWGIDKDKIHYELFTVKKKEEPQEKLVSTFLGESHVTVVMDGEDFEFDLKSDGDFILDAAIEAGADAPFSCKGAVCCTCKALIKEGQAVMELNYSLTEEEVAQGYILTCQAHPATDKLVIDYDVT